MYEPIRRRSRLSSVELCPFLSCGAGCGRAEWYVSPRGSEPHLIIKSVAKTQTHASHASDGRVAAGFEKTKV